MSKAPKMCFDRILQRDINQRMRVRSLGEPGGPVRAIAPKSKKWVNGSTLTIRFLDGTGNQKDMVRDFAPQWTEHANLNFEFTDDPRALVRVTFDSSDGAWSYVGTDNEHIPLHAATLNLGWQDEGVILHEFGHMIGLAHEHSSPFGGGIEWNEQAVIDDLSGPPNFWSPAQIRHNVFHKYAVDHVHGTDFDENSIMLYAFPNSWTVGDFETHANEKLSAIDEAFIQGAEMYPGRSAPSEAATELVVAAAVEATIEQSGEEDLFKFTADQGARYTIATSGDTDVYMSLYGPNDSTVLVAEDDDSGAGRNARIQADLGQGEYFVQVRHYNDMRTGDYRILVSR